MRPTIRKSFGSAFSSKPRRLSFEQKVLEKNSNQIRISENANPTRWSVVYTTKNQKKKKIKKVNVLNHHHDVIKRW